MNFKKGMNVLVRVKDRLFTRFSTNDECRWMTDNAEGAPWAHLCELGNVEVLSEGIAL